MKYLFLSVLFLTFFSLTSAAQDILVMKNTSEYDGKVIKTLYNCKIVVFKTNKTRFYIPTKDIASIHFTDEDNKVFWQLLQNENFVRTDHSDFSASTNMMLINNYIDLECYKKIDMDLLSLYPSNWKELSIYSIAISMDKKSLLPVRF